MFGPITISLLVWSEADWWRLVNNKGREMLFRDGRVCSPEGILASTGFRQDAPFRLEFVGHWIVAKQNEQLYGMGECDDAPSIRTFIRRANAIMRRAQV